MKRRALLAGLAGLAGSKVHALHPNSALTARRVMLSIGVSNYDHGPSLPSAAMDAVLVAESFSKIGFDTTVTLDPTEHELFVSLAKLRLQASDADLVVIYVAAHGVMKDGQSHILPKDFEFKRRGSRKASIPESVLTQSISDKPRQKVLFLDTCRENPSEVVLDCLPTPKSAPYRAGVYVGYAAQQGAKAIDGEEGHSPFANALSGTLHERDLELSEFGRQVRLKVLRSTSGLQVPWERSSIVLPVYFNPNH